MKLAGRRAIITGASHGFGFAVAEEFLKEGANVTLCGRHQDALELACERLAVPSNRLSCIQADITKPSDMESLVESALHNMGGLDIVVANAGVYGPKGLLEELDWDEWSTAIDINLKGTVLTCKAVLPHFKHQNYGKIIVLSGGGATKPMPCLSAYAASKAAVVRFVETLAHELGDYRIDINSLAPGALNTRLLDEILAAGPELVGKAFYEQSLLQQKQGGVSLSVGAELCTYLASAESDGISGKLISAIWDPWQQFDKFKDQLQKSDIYTLRRIVPEDRQQNWSELC